MEADTRQHWQFLPGVIMIGDGRTKERGRSAIRNERPPAGGTTMMRRNRRNREPTVGRRPSYHRRPIGPRRHTARLFSPPSLCPVHGKLIRGNAGKDDRPEADRACPPRCPDRFADRIKGERKWIGLRSILGFLTFSKILHRRIRETIHWWDCNWS